MKGSPKQWLYWSPRVLCILFTLFISMFALDIFAEGYGFWETIVGLFMHLVPTWIILAALIIAWRWEWVGGIVFPAIGMFFAFRFGGPNNWLIYFVFLGLPLLIGALFLLDWWYRRTQRQSSA